MEVAQRCLLTLFPTRPPTYNTNKHKQTQTNQNKKDVTFADYIKSLEAKGKPVVVAGDLNCAHKEIDIHNPKGNLKSAGFTPVGSARVGSSLPGHLSLIVPCLFAQPIPSSDLPVSFHLHPPAAAVPAPPPHTAGGARVVLAAPRRRRRPARRQLPRAAPGRGASALFSNWIIIPLPALRASQQQQHILRPPLPTTPNTNLLLSPFPPPRPNRSATPTTATASTRAPRGAAGASTTASCPRRSRRASTTPTSSTRRRGPTTCRSAL